MTIPGFIDLQVNGCVGVEYYSESLTEEGFIKSCLTLKAKGTIAFLPTIITTSKVLYKRNLTIMLSAMKKHSEIREMVLGFHIEGPFLSPKDGARGAHPKEFIQEPDIVFLKQLIKWSEGNIKLLTIAAELKGARKLCEFAVENGIVVSLGHQMAVYSDIMELQKAGAKGLTHLGNANPHLVDRHKNALIAGLAAQELDAMMITDGHHIPDELIRLILISRSPKNTIVVSDASPFAGLPPGDYSTMGQRIRITNSGKLYNIDEGYLVGSSYTMLECMNYLSMLNFIDMKELELVSFYNPLKFIGIDENKVLGKTSLKFNRNQFYCN
ncbi:MAG: amidohydrolase family protein [Balneolaceae bacterium]